MGKSTTTKAKPQKVQMAVAISEEKYSELEMMDEQELVELAGYHCSMSAYFNPYLNVEDLENLLGSTMDQVGDSGLNLKVKPPRTTDKQFAMWVVPIEHEGTTLEYPVFHGDCLVTVALQACCGACEVYDAAVANGDEDAIVWRNPNKPKEKK